LKKNKNSKIKMRIKSKIVLALLTIFTMSCGAQEAQLKNKDVFKKMESKTMNQEKKTELATFGGGCFWCTEAQLLMLNGVIKVESGYAGGQTENPTYKEVCSGLTGHAEVIQVTYDASIISFDEILAAFWQAHDPTQLNKQGNDVGTQYRSVIFYHNDEQKKIAEDYKLKLNTEQAYDKPVVTEIAPLTIFYKAEDYHQNYYNYNKEAGYCQFVVQPKVEKFKKIFANKLKK
jgi:peptide-methionine (S)-S-oxide reductase